MYVKNIADFLCTMRHQMEDFLFYFSKAIMALNGMSVGSGSVVTGAIYFDSTWQFNWFAVV